MNKLKIVQADLNSEPVQTSLNGVWRDRLNGCPHLHCRADDVDRCDANEMRPCVYETDSGPCETWEEILEEWTRELEVCTECGQERPDDERVKNGMKCSFCAEKQRVNQGLFEGSIVSGIGSQGG